MHIKSVTISGANGRALDAPIRFPAPCQPALKTAPDVRIETQEEKDFDNQGLDHYARLEDERRHVKFGGRNIL